MDHAAPIRMTHDEAGAYKERWRWLDEQER